MICIQVGLFDDDYGIWIILQLSRKKWVTKKKSILRAITICHHMESYANRANIEFDIENDVICGSEHSKFDKDENGSTVLLLPTEIPKEHK